MCRGEALFFRCGKNYVITAKSFEICRKWKLNFICVEYIVTKYQPTSMESDSLNLKVQPHFFYLQIKEHLHITAYHLVTLTN